MQKTTMVLLVLSVIGILFLAGCSTFENKPATQQQPKVIYVQQPQQQISNPSNSIVYVDLSGNLMDKAKFITNPSNNYAGITGQAVKFYDITSNPQNDPRSNVLSVPDFQIVSSSTSGSEGSLSGTKKGISGHTYVYLFENETGSFYDVSGTFTIPSNVNPHAPAFDFGNLLAPKVGTIYTYNDSGDRTDDAYHANFSGALASTTKSTDLRIQVGSLTYAEFVRIWGEYTSTGTKATLVGVSAMQKSGPTQGVTIDASDEKNPIITINEVSAMYPLTFTYYFQGGATVETEGEYTIYIDDWNGVPGKFAAKIDTDIDIY